LVPEIRTFDAPWTQDGTVMRPVYPECGCDESKQAARRDATQQEQREREMRAAAFRLRLHNAGLAGWLADATFETFEPRKDWKGAARLVVEVRKFVDGVVMDTVGHAPWLILYGRYGTGKTHLAAGQDAPRSGGYPQRYRGRAGRLPLQVVDGLPQAVAGLLAAAGR
jgi:hypothetical protein